MDQGKLGCLGEQPKGEVLTRAGRRQLETETDAWQRLTAAVSLVLDMA
jgi:hypothetical protein